jgi:hypothetical protein
MRVLGRIINICGGIPRKELLPPMIVQPLKFYFSLQKRYPVIGRQMADARVLGDLIELLSIGKVAPRVGDNLLLPDFFDFVSPLGRHFAVMTVVFYELAPRFQFLDPPLDGLFGRHVVANGESSAVRLENHSQGRSALLRKQPFPKAHRLPP